MNNTGHHKQLLEALLFMKGDAVSKTTLQQQLGVKQGQLEELVQELQQDYTERGVTVIVTDTSVKMAVSDAVAEGASKALKKEMAGPLTKATSEVLAIIAYQGPVSRNDIDFIRGVNSSSAVRTLLLRKLIEQRENPEDSRSSLLYITPECLQYFGITAKEELPSWDEVQKQLQELQNREQREEEHNNAS